MASNEQTLEKFITYPPENQYCNFNSFYMPSQFVTASQERKKIRVILGQLGNLFRMSAPEIDIVADGSTANEAWTKFLLEVRKLNKKDWLEFDVGPTRQEEVSEGLNAPENEDWSEAVKKVEG
jgi:hypothetical protein